MRPNPVWLGLILAVAMAAPAAALAAGPSRIFAEALGAGGSALCLAVAQNRPLLGPFEVPATSAAGLSHQTSGPFYPVVAAPCAALGSNPALWTATVAHELRVDVQGRAMCATVRRLTAFQPLVDPYVRAFEATKLNSPFAALVGQLRSGPRGVLDPPLLVGACGEPDGQDALIYDAPSGTISAPGGFGWSRLCLTLNTQASANSELAATSTPVPVRAFACEDSLSGAGQNALGFDRALLPIEQRWRRETGTETLPFYPSPDPRDYASGRHGLPITGPMGRCLTALANNAATTDCDGRIDQDWKFADNQIRLESKNLCLAASASEAPTLAPCSTERAQLWSYTVRDYLASRAWADSDLYGQLRPLDDPQRCLAVAIDPFEDPARSLNSVQLLECTATPTRRMSWFVTTRMETIRVALVRFGHAPDHVPMGVASNARIEAAFAEAVARLSANYRRVGLRFVFDAAHDYREVDDPAAANTADASAIATALSRLAANDFYGKLTVALTERYAPAGPLGMAIDYEPARIADPVTGELFDYATWRTKHDSGVDRAGLPALSNFIDVSPALTLDLPAGLRLSRAVGSYFGLRPTNSPARPADTPAEVANAQAWLDQGATPCGNLKTAMAAGKAVTPDRTNALGAFECQLGRGLAALTPMQEARIVWAVHNQLDRQPLIACAAPSNYFGDRLICETPAALALCKETAAWLARNAGGEALLCFRGDPISRDAAAALKWAGMQFIFKSTPQGQALINALTGRGKGPGPVADLQLDAVSAALLANDNPPLARALMIRVNEIRVFTARNHPQMRDRAYTEKPEKTLDPDDLSTLEHASAAVLTFDFAANVPVLTK